MVRSCTGCMKSWMPGTLGRLFLQVADDLMTFRERSSRGFSVIRKRPWLSVALVPSTPMKDEDMRRHPGPRGRRREGLLVLRHALERGALGRLRDALDLPRILNREEAFRHFDIEQHREHERGDEDGHRQRLAVEDPVQRVAVCPDRSLKPAVAPAPDPYGRLLRMQEARAQHGHERQRDDGGDDDGDGERDREFVEQAADDVAHEQQRDQYGDQRDRERDDGEADLLRAFQARLRAACRLPRGNA